MADALALQRRALAALIATRREFHVVGEADRAEVIVRQCRERPGVLAVVDTRLPAPGGVDAVRWIRDRAVEARILAIVHEAGQKCSTDRAQRTGEPDPKIFCCARHDCLGIALLDGADGVVSRSARPRELFEAMRRITANPDEDSRRRLACAQARRNLTTMRRLSAREREVAVRIGDGSCNKEIARALGIGVPTVKKHVGKICAKLGLESRLQIGLFVTRHPGRFSPG